MKKLVCGALDLREEGADQKKVSDQFETDVNPTGYSLRMHLLRTAANALRSAPSEAKVLILDEDGPYCGELMVSFLKIVMQKAKEKATSVIFALRLNFYIEVQRPVADRILFSGGKVVGNASTALQNRTRFQLMVDRDGN
jgi:nucleoside-triphosphatase THEP1